MIDTLTRATADELYRLRARTGLSQALFAHRCGVRRETVSHWEQGHTQPTLLESIGLRALCDARKGE